MSLNSFDFLASEPEWEQNCLQDPRKYLDNFPPAFVGSKGKRWSFPAQLLSTLAIFSRDKYVNDRDLRNATLASLAKHGDSKGVIKGYPGYVQSLRINLNQPEGKETDESLWCDYSAPKPEMLNCLPKNSLLLTISVELLSPFYSRDDQPFYPTENTLRRDSLFDIPCFPPSSIKGLLRWAYNLTHTKNDLIEKQLFGSSSEEVMEDTCYQGSLYCYPLYWSGNIGLEIINPKNRETGAGTNPIYYEVVKEGGLGTLYFLIVNNHQNIAKMTQKAEEFLKTLDFFLKSGGLSAKTTTGWGHVKIRSANAAIAGYYKEHTDEPAAKSSPGGASSNELLKEAQNKNAEAAWEAFVGPDGQLLPLEGNEAVFTNKRIKDVIPGCSNKMVKDKAACYQKIQELFAQRQPATDQNTETTQEESQESSDSKNSTSWIWGNGVDDFAIYSNELLQILREKESHV